MTKRGWGWLLVGCFLIAIFAAPFASSFPDGLEWVAEEQAFLDKAVETPSLASPIPDYTMPGVTNEKVATSAAGVVGTGLVFFLLWGVGSALSRKQASEE